MHLRAGEPCVRCGSTIVKMRAAGRGTYLCPRCQRGPRAEREALGGEQVLEDAVAVGLEQLGKPPIARAPTRICGNVSAG